VVVNAEPTKANKTTPGSERQSLLKNDLTGPTLLEMSDKSPSDLLLRRGDVKLKEWHGGDGVGNHHVEILLTLHAFNRLMRHLPESCSRLRMHDLFLLAVNAGNSDRDDGPLHLCLSHDQPPASSCNFRLSASILSRPLPL